MTKAEAAKKAAEYQARYDALIAASLSSQVVDIQLLQRLYAEFVRDALALVSSKDPSTRAAILSTLQSLAARLDVLMENTQGVIYQGMTSQQHLINEISKAYGETFFPYGATIPFIQLTPADLQLIAAFSADLVSLREGGLGAEMLAKLNRELQLGALGAQGNYFDGAAAVNRALGGPAQWSVRAEKIYRTEVNRMFSMLTQRAGEELNAYVRTYKRWKWSHISRKEHARIDNQTVPIKGRFRVPLREGGTVRMRYPRDASAPPSATVNCGCFVELVPASMARTK